MEEKQLLSVVVPVYNNEQYLAASVESILQQKYTELELILVDDGSTDHSGRICDAYARKDSRVRVIRKANEGACYARRDGILAAKGEYITFVDSDDWIDTDMYETLYGLLLENRADIITSGFIRNESEEISHDLLPEGLYAGEEKENLCANMLFHREQNTVGIIMSVCNKIYRRALLIPFVTKLPLHIHLWEDLVYTYPPFITAKRVVITHKCFYHYRRNAQSTSIRFDSMEYEKTAYTLSVAREVYRRYGQSIQETFDLESSLILYNYLRRCAGNEHHRYGTCREIMNKMKNISKDSHFRIPVKAVIQKIPLEQERRFFQYLLDGKVAKVIWYYRYTTKKQETLNRAARMVRDLLGEQRIQRIKKVLRLVD
ncbi:MAG: glycosyltransferase [Clostridium sp.]|nr:glycosyltransferase [Clostridium sp.]